MDNKLESELADVFAIDMSLLRSSGNSSREARQLNNDVIKKLCDRYQSYQKYNRNTYAGSNSFGACGVIDRTIL